MTPRLVLLFTATLALFTQNAQAEVCLLDDGREFSTNHMGDITSPIDLVGYRLRERDDLQGYEIVRLWSHTYDVRLVQSCVQSFDHGGGDGFGLDPLAAASSGSRSGGRNQGPKGPRDSHDGGRDSGGHCDNQGDEDSSCAPRRR